MSDELRPRDKLATAPAAAAALAKGAPMRDWPARLTLCRSTNPESPWIVALNDGNAEMKDDPRRETEAYVLATALQQQRKQVITEVEEALTSGETVEIAAKAEWESDEARSELSAPWDEAPEGIRDEYRTDMLVAIRAALATLTKGGIDV